MTLVGPVARHYKFTGKERDPESGLDNFGARYNSSSMGRWMSPDVVNLTDARVQNPANTLNKYVYGGNNPLKYIDPDGRDITVFYYPGGIAGHIVLLAYDPQSGASAVKSYGPASESVGARLAEGSMLVGTPGTEFYGFADIKSAAQLREQVVSLTVQTSPEMTQQAIQTILSNPSLPYYFTLFNNCTTTCASILRKLQLSKSHAITPEGFFTDIYKQYGNGTAPHTRFGYLFQTGQNYGKGKFGYDPFDILFKSIQQPHEEVTVKMCKTDENGKPVCQ